MSKDLNNKIYRILDANLNRLKEGLRVCEEVCRFVMDDKGLTIRFKRARHRASAIFKSLPQGFRNITLCRDSDKDIGRDYSKLELKRDNILEIIYANIQRSKESLRVLEEFTKLIRPRLSLKFKELRYEIYSLEKDTLKKLSSLSYLR